MTDKLFITDDIWEQKYIMRYVPCKHCGGGGYYRIESMNLHFTCSACSRQKEYSFMDELPDDCNDDEIKQWQIEMKRDYIKYHLKHKL